MATSCSRSLYFFFCQLQNVCNISKEQKIQIHFKWKHILIIFVGKKQILKFNYWRYSKKRIFSNFILSLINIPFWKSSYLTAIIGTVTVIALPIDSCLNNIATYNRRKRNIKSSQKNSQNCVKWHIFYCYSFTSYW